jgi:putative flippase GtrA
MVRAVPSAVVQLLRSRQVRYLLVGGYNTAFGYLLFAILYILLGERVHYTLLLLISHVISVLNAFVAYRLVVFRVKGSVARDLLRFWSVYASAFAVNLLLLPVAVSLGAPVLPAQAAFVVVTIVTTYVLNATFSFNRGAERDGQAASVKSTTAI